jgi:hypothetical protein
MTAPSLRCVIRLTWRSLVGLMSPRGMLAMPEEPMDRTRLPIRRPTFQGVVNWTVAGSKPDWGQIGHIERGSGSGGVR